MQDDDYTCDTVLDKRPANVNEQDDLQERPVWQQFLALQTEWMERLLYEVCFAVPTECIHVYTQQLYPITRSQFSVCLPPLVGGASHESETGTQIAPFTRLAHLILPI